MTKHLKIEKGSGNIFRDLGFPPGEAQNLIMRAELMVKIEQFVSKSGMTQKEATRLRGITQPRLNLLLKRKIELCGKTAPAFSPMGSRRGPRAKDGAFADSALPPSLAGVSLDALVNRVVRAGMQVKLTVKKAA